MRRNLEEVRSAQKQASELGLVGGIIYDLFHLVVARLEDVERFYTFNIRHFRSIAQLDMLNRIVEP